MENSDTVPAPGVPAGWYPDPTQAHTQRYWDGAAWTEQRAPLQPPAAADESLSIPVSALVVLSGIIAAGVAVFLPYVDAGVVTVTNNSLIQHAEGKIILVLALVAALALYRALNHKGWWISTGALGLVILAIAGYLGGNPPELVSASSNPFLAPSTETDPGVGIYLAGIGGLLIMFGGLNLPRWGSKSSAASTSD